MLYVAHLRRKLSSEKGLDGLRTRDRPRSTFHDVGDATGEEEASSSSFESEPRSLVRLRRVSRGDLLEALSG